MPRITGSRTVLAVRDLATSVQFYRDVLGFEEEWGDGSWSFLRRDGARVMLGECPGERPASEIGDHSYVMYLVVDDADGWHATVSAHSAAAIAPPVTEPWGMREFGIRTPDGHRIRFGQPTHAEE